MSIEAPSEGQTPIEWFEGVRESEGDYTAVELALSGSYTPDGIRAWWQRERSQLGDRTPAQAWDDDREAVMELARSLLA